MPAATAPAVLPALPPGLPVPAGLGSLADLRSRADEAAVLLKALANPDRLLLLCCLVEGECSVGALGAATGIGQPSLSQQLAVLRAERLVGTRRDGQRVCYRITAPAALAVLRTLHDLFCSNDPMTSAQDPA